MTHLDKAAGIVITLLVLALVFTAWIGNPVELRVEMLQQGEGTGPMGPLILEFNHPVHTATLAGNLVLEPQGLLAMQAITPRRVSLTPAGWIRPDEPATLRLVPGRYGINGEALKVEQAWEVRLRPAQIVYLTSEPDPREVYRVALDGSGPVQMSHTDGRVYSFDVASDGEQIVYAVVNDQHGVDLWQMSRTGEDGHRLLECGADRCTTPAFSPDGKQLAYTREAAGLSPGSAPGAPRPWVLQLTTGQTNPVYADTQAIGYGPSWSPDGRRLAIWDGVSGGIRVLDLQTGEEVLLPTQSGETGGWSPDGTQLLFTRYEQADGGYYTFVYRADFTLGSESVFIDGGAHDSMYGTPAWSPDGTQIALSLRPVDDSPARAIWIVRPDFLGGPAIGDEPDWAYGFYRWNNWGTSLVMQRRHLAAGNESEIVVYDLTTGEMRTLAAGGGWPQWLP